MARRTAGLPCGCEPAGAAQLPAAEQVTDLPRVHDPAIAKEGDTYYVFSTGRGITVTTSKDRIHWQRQGRLFEKPISWTASFIPGSTDYYWAPDISFFAGKWHLYYSISTFGKNRSAIGLATSPALDPHRPDYAWKDEGLVLDSSPSDEGRWRGPGHNAALRERAGDWLVFHAYDAEDHGYSKLRIEKLVWDKEGWPSVAAKGADVDR